MGKLGRSYSLSVQTQSGATLVIKPPFTLEFDIARNTLSSANHASFRIYNLSRNNRNQIRFNIDNYGVFRSIELRAGYGTNLPLIFKGNISQAWSVRENVNFITQIQCFDGGFAFNNGITSQQFQKNTSQDSIIRSIAGSLPGVSVGAIGSYPGVLTRGNAYNGSGTDILRELSGGGFFIDNSKVNCLGDNECVLGETLIISPESGLLGTPVREQTILHFDMIFEPSLILGQRVELRSVTDTEINEFYKVISLQHRGVISEAVSGTAITTVGLFAGTAALREVPSL